MRGSLNDLLREVRTCEVCKANLPLGPRPVVQLGRKARIVIVGQAPGTKVHESGVPWKDPSGDHLRQWLGVDEKVFYDRQRFALMPMGFCYPGKKGAGDAPPRPECAPLWHDRLLSELCEEALILLVGQYAHGYYLKKMRKKTLAETVQAFEEYLPKYFVLPHPSWRSRIWMEKNPWFANRVLPHLRAEVNKRMGTSIS